MQFKRTFFYKNGINKKNYTLFKFVRYYGSGNLRLSDIFNLKSSLTF